MGLHRNLAPISEEAWKAIDEEARRVLELHLSARALMDFEGPRGWEFSSIDLGRARRIESGPDGETLLRRRVVRPLIELRVGFSVPREEIERVDRGAGDPDLSAVVEAAKDFAAAEDVALFEGYADADVPGLLTDAGCEGIALPSSARSFPEAVAEGLDQLRSAGVAGPYVLALCPESYNELTRATSEGGQPVLAHVERLLGGDVIWAPNLRGGLIASRRGGDARMICGRDASIGYESHDGNAVRLYLEESFNAVLEGPEALCPLLPSDGDEPTKEKS